MLPLLLYLKYNTMYTHVALPARSTVLCGRVTHVYTCTCTNVHVVGSSPTRGSNFSLKDCCLGIWFVCLCLVFHKCLSIYHVQSFSITPSLQYQYWVAPHACTHMQFCALFYCPCSCVCARLQFIAGMCPGLARCPEFLLHSTSASREMTWQAVPSLGTRYMHCK